MDYKMEFIIPANQFVVTIQRTQALTKYKWASVFSGYTHLYPKTNIIRTVFNISSISIALILIASFDLLNKLYQTILKLSSYVKIKMEVTV